MAGWWHRRGRDPAAMPIRAIRPMGGDHHRAFHVRFDEGCIETNERLLLNREEFDQAIRRSFKRGVHVPAGAESPEGWRRHVERLLAAQSGG